MFVYLGDPEDEALRRALAFAHRVGARLTVCGVAEQTSLDLLGVSGLGADRLERVALESTRDALEELRSRVGASVSVATLALHGRPLAAVIREVTEGGHDLVMVAAQGARGSIGRFMPTTTLQLVRSCPCPVWLVHATARDEIKRVGAAVDADGERFELDRSILSRALAVAGAFSARVDVIHALTLFPSRAMLRGRGGMSEADVEALVARSRARAETTLRGLASGAQAPWGVVVEHHVLEGAPAHVIAEYAKQAALDLLVMGTLGRTGIAAMVIGSTAEEILQRADCSILALKPPGFAAAGAQD